ncbi:MAG: hypothetical protein ABI175_20600 [Polyangiales bacterium]
MLGNLAKRAVELAILFLAAVTFFLVPFGSRTLFQHCKAIFTTAPAAELGREIEKKGQDVVAEVKKTVAPSDAPPAAPAKPGK